MTDQRQVPLQGAANFRDMGGYPTASGKQVARGKLYRADALNNLTPSDVERLQELGLKTIVDYRGEKERVGHENVAIPDTTTHYLDPVADIAALASAAFQEQAKDLYNLDNLTGALVRDLMIQQNKAFVKNEQAQAAYRQLLMLALDETALPLVHHCRGGKDRTGYGAALILGLLGVSREDILADYLLTNHYKQDKNEKSLAEVLAQTGNQDMVDGLRHFKEAHVDFLTTALALIESDYGDVQTYAKQVLGLTQQDIDRLHTLYLVDGHQTSPSVTP